MWKMDYDHSVLGSFFILKEPAPFVSFNSLIALRSHYRLYPCVPSHETERIERNSFF